MTEKILQKNLEIIGQYNPFILNDLLKLDFSQTDEELIEDIDVQGKRSVYFRFQDKKYLLHSRYDPFNESKRVADKIEKNKNYLVIVMGLGLGYHLFELKNKISKETRVVIVEHNLNVLKYVLTHIDLSDIFKSGQFVLLFGSEQQLAKNAIYLGVFGFYNLIHNMKVLVLPNYYVYSKQNQIALKLISKSLFNQVLSYGNDLEDQFFGLENMCHNTEAIMKSNSIDEIKEKYKGFPAIIVASGPSLDKNIQYLKEAEGRALIIACDASMRACDKIGLKPDAVASIERLEPTYTFFYKDRKFPKDLVLLAPGSIWPKIYEEFEGKTISMSRNDTGFETLWMSSFENFKFVSLGHSCATVAFSVARQAGCNPIILIGQDLAYTDGKKHSNLTHYDGENNANMLTDIFFEDNEGNLLKSSMVFKLFKDWYEFQISNNPDLQVINATEGGAKIEGAIPMKFVDAIQKYCHKPIEKHLIDHLLEKDINAKNTIIKYDELIKNIDDSLNLLEKIKKESLVHLNMLLKIEKVVSRTCNREKLTKLVLKMQQGDKIIQKILQEPAINSYYKPIILQTIAQVNKIGNELTLENVKTNCLLQHNLMFMIVHSTDLILSEYNKAKAIVEQRKEKIRV